MEMHDENGYGHDNNYYSNGLSEDLRSPSPPLMDGADEGQMISDGFCYDDEQTPLVPMTFMWAYSGTSVLVTGSFFNWRNTIALHRRIEKETGFYNGAPSPSPSASFASITSIINSTINNNNNGGNVGGKMVDAEDIFSTVLYLPPGKYEYKFIVDGAWHYDPRQPVVTDESGNLNNFVVVETLPSRVVEPLLNDDYHYLGVPMNS